MEVVGPASLHVLGSLKVVREGQEPLFLEGPITLSLLTGSVMITPQDRKGTEGQRSTRERAGLEAVREASSPLEILPEELWLVIMAYLKGSRRDLINLAATNTWFSSLVQVEYPGIRLAEVLPFIVKWIESWDLMRIKLTCRLVSQMVENILESVQHCSSVVDSGVNFTSLTPPHFRGPSGTGGGFEWSLFHYLKDSYGFSNDYGVTLERLDKLEKLKLDFELKKIGRVPGKYIKISQPYVWRGQAPDVNFLNRTLIPLVRMTDAITSLEGEFDLPRGNGIGEYNFIANILSALPNLRCLAIEFRLSAFRIVALNRNEFRQHVQGHPLPASPSLESLAIRGRSFQREFFEEIASRYGGHLLALRLNFDTQLLHRRPSSTGNSQCRELRKLRLSLNWNMLPFLRTINAPNLQWLTFQVASLSRDVMDLAALSRALGHFPALSTLELELPILPLSPVDYSVDMSALRRLCHENVKHFKFIGFHLNAPTLAFAAMFPNLSSLNVKIEDGISRHRSVQVRTDPELSLISNWRGQESKLWSELKKLEIIIFEDRRPIRHGRRESESYQRVVCTRKQANQYSR